MSKVVTSSFICLTLVQSAMAGRVKRGENRSVGSCRPGKIRCDKVRDFLEIQQANGNCRPMDPRYISCEEGSEPASNAWMWKSPDFTREAEGQRCSKRYEARQCLYTNDRFVNDGGRAPKLRSASGSAECTTPKLDIADCEKLMTTLAEHEKNKQKGGDAGQKVEALTNTIIDLQQRGPHEYYWLPAFRNAIWELSESVLKVLETSQSYETKKTLVAPLKTLLMYCRGSKERAIAINNKKEHDKVPEEDAIASGFKECKGVTQIEIMFASTAFRKELEMADEINSLSNLGQFEDMAIPYLEEELWDELLHFAFKDNSTVLGRDGMVERYGKLKAKFAELIVNAGERGETELSLALAFSTLKFAGGAKPEGGEDRLNMMRSYRFLKNLVAIAGSSRAPKLAELQAAIQDVTTLAQKTNMEWIDYNDFTQLLNSAGDLFDKLQKGESIVPVKPEIQTTTTSTTIAATTSTTTTIAATTTSTTTTSTTIAATTTSTTTTIAAATTSTTTTIASDVGTGSVDDQSDSEEDGESYAWVWHSVETMWQEKTADDDQFQPVSTRRSSVIAVPMR